MTLPFNCEGVPGLESDTQAAGLQTECPFKDWKWIFLRAVNRPEECRVDQFLRQSTSVNGCNDRLKKLKLLRLAGLEPLGEPILKRCHSRTVS